MSVLMVLSHTLINDLRAHPRWLFIKLKDDLLDRTCGSRVAVPTFTYGSRIANPAYARANSPLRVVGLLD